MPRIGGLVARAHETGLGDAETGARLFGFVEEQFAVLDMARDPAENAVFARLEESLGAALPASDLDRLRAEGAALEVIAGIDLARATVAARMGVRIAIG